MPEHPIVNNEAIADLLKGARALIAPPQTWTQKAFARLRNGDPTSANDPNAVCFCVAGALDCAGNRLRSGPAVWNLAHDILTDEAREPLPSFNDTGGRTHAEVLALYDRAIAAVGA